MFGSTVLEIALGMSLYFIVLSLVCSGVTQYFSQWRSRRGRILVDILGQLVNHKGGSVILTSLLTDARIAGGSTPLATARMDEASPLAPVPIKKLPLPSGGKIGSQAFADTILDMMTKSARQLMQEVPDKDKPNKATDTVAAAAVDQIIKRLNVALDSIHAGAPFALSGMDLGRWDAILREARARVESLAGRPLGSIENEAGAILSQLRAAATTAGGTPSGAVFIDTIARETNDVLHLARGMATARSLELVAADLPESAFKNFLLRLAHKGALQPEDIKSAVQDWYDSVDDRVSIEFRGKTQRVLFITALGVVLLLNADTLQMINRLAQNETLRKNVAEVSSSLAVEQVQREKDAAKLANPNPLTGPASATTVPPKIAPSSAALEAKRKAEIARLDIPLKWTQEDFDNLKGLTQTQDLGLFSKGIYKALGLLVTSLALTMGAEFWYNLLKNLVSFRQLTTKEERSASTS